MISELWPWLAFFAFVLFMFAAIIISIGWGISSFASFTKKKMEPSLERQQRVYNDLPDLGKARIDRKHAQAVLVFVPICIIVVGIGISIILTPIGGFFAAFWLWMGWGKDKMKEAKNDIRDADSRRNEILNS